MQGRKHRFPSKSTYYKSRPFFVGECGYCVSAGGEGGGVHHLDDRRVDMGHKDYLAVSFCSREGRKRFHREKGIKKGDSGESPGAT